MTKSKPGVARMRCESRPRSSRTNSPPTSCDGSDAGRSGSALRVVLAKSLTTYWEVCRLPASLAVTSGLASRSGLSIGTSQQSHHPVQDLVGEGALGDQRQVLSLAGRVQDAALRQSRPPISAETSHLTS